MLGESAKPSPVGPAKMLPPTRGEQSPAAPARKRRCPRPGSGCRGGDTPNAPSPASRHLYGSEKCFTGDFGKAVKCVCVAQHHCGASDGHRPAGCGRSRCAWRLRGLWRCWAPPGVGWDHGCQEPAQPQRAASRPLHVPWNPQTQQRSQRSSDSLGTACPTVGLEGESPHCWAGAPQNPSKPTPCFLFVVFFWVPKPSSLSR